MHTRSLAIAAVLTISAAAHADTLQEFSFRATTDRDYFAGVQGTFLLNEDTSQVLSATAQGFFGQTLFANYPSFEVYPLFGFVDVTFTNLDYANYRLSDLQILLPVSDLVGYQGGSICSLSEPCDGFLYSSYDVYSISYLGDPPPNMIDYGNFYAGYVTATTPEPASLALLATGALGLLSLGRRRSGIAA